MLKGHLHLHDGAMHTYFSLLIQAVCATPHKRYQLWQLLHEVPRDHVISKSRVYGVTKQLIESGDLVFTDDEVVCATDVAGKELAARICSELVYLEARHRELLWYSQWLSKLGFSQELIAHSVNSANLPGSLRR